MVNDRKEDTKGEVRHLQAKEQRIGGERSFNYYSKVQIAIYKLTTTQKTEGIRVHKNRNMI